MYLLSCCCCCSSPSEDKRLLDKPNKLPVDPQKITPQRPYIPDTSTASVRTSVPKANVVQDPTAAQIVLSVAIGAATAKIVTSIGHHHSDSEQHSTTTTTTTTTSSND